MSKLSIGSRVEHRSFSHIIPPGTIFDIQPGLVVGVQITSERYKVLWDNGETSGWLSDFDLIETWYVSRETEFCPDCIMASKAEWIDYEQCGKHGRQEGQLWNIS